jgi:hypothetical protein
MPKEFITYLYLNKESLAILDGVPVLVANDLLAVA